MKNEITQEELQKYFYYKDGKLFNKVDRGSEAKKDKEAGWIYFPFFYKRIGIKKRKYSVHRIIWILLKGEIPKNLQIDHIDGNRLNNKIENLRLVTSQENQRNRKINKNNTSGTCGIDYNKKSKKWRASLRVKEKYIFLGLFEIIEEAIKARKDAEIKYGFHKNHGKR